MFDTQDFFRISSFRTIFFNSERIPPNKGQRVPAENESKISESNFGS